MTLIGVAMRVVSQAWAEQVLEHPFSQRLEIAADVEVTAAKIIAASVEILLLVGLLIGRIVGAVLAGMGAAGQHAGDGTTKQYTAGNAHRRLCRASQEAATALSAPVVVVALLAAIPGPTTFRAPRRLRFVTTEEPTEEAAGWTLAGLKLLDPLLCLPQGLLLDEDGLGHIVGRRRKFAQPLLDLRFGIAISRLAVAGHVFDTVEQAIDGLLVLLVRHVPTPWSK